VKNLLSFSISIRIHILEYLSELNLQERRFEDTKGVFKEFNI